MQIELHEILVKDLFDGYADNQEEGVIGYGGKLNIRPPFQREFVYNDKQRDAVIATVKANFPLNVMYWAVRSDGNYEIIDGQQRTLSLCQYINGDFSYEKLAFHNLQDDEQEQILNYKLMIYFCEGTDSEKLKWFKTINIAGEKLTDQELRNAVYAGSWLADAKIKFSKTNCAAYKHGKEYVVGSPIRQEFLETAIDWINEGKIEEYMSKHQHEQNANELWLYFQSAIQWTKAVFPVYRKEMKNVHWGMLYNKFKDKHFDTAKLELQIKTLMMDDDVTNKKGIYEYVLTQDERCLHVRVFTESMKRSAYERQNGICKKCGQHFELDAMEADHVTPWSKGGKTSQENCQMLCKDCNRRKAGK